jgi:hypothetical protein
VISPTKATSLTVWADLCFDKHDPECFAFEYPIRALQAYMGHKNIQHTVRYTELAPGRFKDFWKD